MLNFTMLFKKSVLVMLVASLAIVVFPTANVYASGLAEPTDPPAAQAQVSNERIEQVWARLKNAYERQGQFLDRADEMTAKIQDLLDRMNENGKDTTSLQAVLDTYKDALKDAHPVYESAKGVINSHKGFDADGKVTDREQAIETLKELGAKMKEIRQSVVEPGKALREAIKAYREARRPVTESGPEG